MFCCIYFFGEVIFLYSALFPLDATVPIVFSPIVALSFSSLAKVHLAYADRWTNAPQNMNKKVTKKMGKPASGETGSEASLDRSPIHLLHRAGQCAGDIFQSKLGTTDLTPRQFAVLVTVSQNEGLSQTQLVDKTGIDRSTLADIVRRMLKKNLLQRRRTREDARAYAVKLTEEGWRILRQVEPTAIEVDGIVLAALGSVDRDRFIDNLNTIVEALSPLTSGTDTDKKS